MPSKTCFVTYQTRVYHRVFHCLITGHPYFRCKKVAPAWADIVSVRYTGTQSARLNLGSYCRFLCQ